MEIQPQLFDTSPENPEDDRKRRWSRRLAPHNGTVTSIAAAAGAQKTKPTTSEAIFRFVFVRGETGATREEIAEGLHLPIQTVCARVSEMLAERDLQNSPSRIRKTKSGRAAQVIIAGVRFR